MITLKLSLILAFSLKPKLEAKRKQSENLGKEYKKTQKNKTSVHEQVDVLAVHPKHMFEMDRVIGTAHIEYELIPNKIKYECDVKCWGPIAKIFTNNNQISLKVITRDGMAWVPICLEHYLDGISTDEIKKLHNYIVKFDISNSANKLGKAAAEDKSNKFYAFAEEADMDCFIRVYDEDPNLQDEDIGQQKGSLNMHHVDVPKKGSWSGLNYSHNIDVIYEIIDKHCTGVDVDYKNFVLPCPSSHELPKKVNIKIQKSVTSRDQAKSSNKKNEAVKTKAGNIIVSVPAEIFFTDPDLAIYKEKTDNDTVIFVYVLISVKQLLSRTQKLLLDPLVVKIKKLSNLPVDRLKELGITSIYTSYNIPSIAACKSIEKPVKECIKFDEGHIFFNDGVSKLKLIEFIQTRRLLIEIYGINSVLPSEPNPLLFGSETDDKDISKIKPFRTPAKNTNTYIRSVPLAVCTYDISSIIRNIWDFKEKGQCHEPGLTLYQKCMGYYETLNFTDMRNVNEININLKHLEVRNPIFEEILLNFGTTLKIEVYLMAPQTASLILLRIPNTFKRFVFILYNWEIAKNLLTGIIKNNERIILEKKHSPPEELQYADIITGFFIDNGLSLIIFVEGLSAGFILGIENITITNYEKGKGKFFFDTDTVFEKRLYNSFLREGLSIVTLRIPMANILSNQAIYLKGNVPFTCFEALKKLHILVHSSSYKSILQFNLLPKPEELLSLNLEWGVPLMVQRENETL